MIKNNKKILKYMCMAHIIQLKKTFKYIVYEMCIRDSAFGGTLRGMEKKGIYAFHKLKYFETYSIGEYEVTPIRGNHGGNMAKERSANYVLKAKDGTKMLYGMDTGLYEDCLLYTSRCV